MLSRTRTGRRPDQPEQRPNRIPNKNRTGTEQEADRAGPKAKPQGWCLSINGCRSLARRHRTATEQIAEDNRWTGETSPFSRFPKELRTRTSMKKPPCGRLRYDSWLRGKDLNLRPLGYEPNELPDCSTPRHGKDYRCPTTGCQGVHRSSISR